MYPCVLVTIVWRVFCVCWSNGAITLLQEVNGAVLVCIYGAGTSS